MKQIVIKIGTSTLTAGGEKLSLKLMEGIAKQVALLKKRGIKVVIVSSGSITAGKTVLGGAKTSRSLPEKQMLSSIGQVHLMQTWQNLFKQYDIIVGQLLLTRSDFANRKAYLNARNTVESLLAHDVVPIVNENDSIATKEIEFGDNDTLSAQVANLIAADLLILMTDQEGLYTADPGIDPNAQLIKEVDKIDQSIMKLAGNTSKACGFGSGGMTTKVDAAKLATDSGTPTVIVKGDNNNIIVQLVDGDHKGTLFSTTTTPKESRKRWLLSEKTQGKIVIDDGAEKVLKSSGASLLPVGIITVEGTFDRGSPLDITTKKGESIGLGLSNYNSDEVEKLLGVQSSDIEAVLGYSNGPEVIHRDNMALKGSNRELL